MSIDITKLEKVKSKGNKTIARCPACADLGQDRTGDHLIINEDGSFACVIYQGIEGRDHRKRVFGLAGIKEQTKSAISVKKVSQVSQDKPKVKIHDVLGRIGRYFQSHFNKTSISKVDKIDELVKEYEEVMVQMDQGIRRQKEMMFSDKWDHLEKEDRKRLVDRLLEKELLPEKVKKVCEMFNGEVVSLI